MKKLAFLFICIALFSFFSCEDLFDKDKPGILKGDQSPMGEVGTTISSSSATIAGVSNFQATVTALSGDVSSITGSAEVTNQAIRNIFTSIPGVTVNGNTVTGTDIKFRNTTEGIELMSGPTAGILVKYGSKVGDTYPIGNTGRVRTVVEKTDSDDYAYGFLLIKTIKVEETGNKLKSSGISKITYIANHRFGLVGFKVTLNDNTEVKFPVYSSAENN